MIHAPLDLPVRWRIDLIDNLARRGTGHTPDKNRPDYWNGGIKWVSLADSSKLDRIFIYETDKEISEAGIRNSSAVKHSAGTVILSRDAGVGKSAIIASEMAVSQHFVAWYCGSQLDNVFLYYWLQSMKPEFERIAVGSTIKTIGLRYFETLKIAYPPLPEQRKIAQILSTWDEAIAAAEQLVAALQRRKKGLMQRLLLPDEATGQPPVRFPRFRNEWEHRPFDRVFERVTRKNAIGNTNVLTASGQRGLISQTEFFNRVVAGAQIENYYLLQRGEFAYNRSSSDGYPFGAIKRLDDHEAGILSTLYLCFRLADDMCVSSFYKHFFEAGGLDRGIYSIAQEGARNHGLLNVSVVDFFSLSIPVPSRSEQQQLADFFDVVDEEIEVAKKQVEALKTQKKGLMQRLLTGQVRVQM